MQSSPGPSTWDFGPAIDLLKTLSFSEKRETTSQLPIPSKRSSFSDLPLVLSQAEDEDLSLGNFSRIWEYLALSHDNGGGAEPKPPADVDEDAERFAKEVRWRDEVSGVDLEDNMDTGQHVSRLGLASLRTQQRAQRRLRARERASKTVSRQATSYETVSDSAENNESDQELDRLRRSPDRRAVIHDILHRPSKNTVNNSSPPTSPSPPKESLRVLKREPALSNPFQWSAPTSKCGSHLNQIRPLGDLSQEQRKSKLIKKGFHLRPST